MFPNGETHSILEVVWIKLLDDGLSLRVGWRNIQPLDFCFPKKNLKAAPFVTNITVAILFI